MSSLHMYLSLTSPPCNYIQNEPKNGGGYVTVVAAWVRTLTGGTEELCLVSDSRLSGGRTMDSAPKLLVLPRGDMALCFAGETGVAYPFMLQAYFASLVHRPARTRGLDLTQYRSHIIKILNSIVSNIQTPIADLRIPDCEFVLGGYSWLYKRFYIWKICYSANLGRFHYNSAQSICGKRESFLLAGSGAPMLRRGLAHLLTSRRGQNWGSIPLDMEPFEALVSLLRTAGDRDSVGGPPQFVKVYQHANALPVPILWPDRSVGQVSVLGRVLLNYEHIDDWALDPDTLQRLSPAAVNAIRQVQSGVPGIGANDESEPEYRGDT